MTAADRKRESTLFAKLALRGITAVRLADGSYVAGRWGLRTRPLPDLDALEAFAKRVGAT